MLACMIKYPSLRFVRFVSNFLVANVRMWSCNTLKATACLALSRANQQDHSIRLWNILTRCCVLLMKGEGGHNNEVISVVRHQEE